MNVNIFLRKRENWKDLKIEDSWFHGKKEKIDFIKNEWNQFFYTWQEFREIISKKSIDELNDLNMPILTTVDEVLKLSDDDVVVPIDDDDWFHPNIEDYIKSEMKDYEILQWTQIVNHCLDERFIRMWGATDWAKSVFFCTSDHCFKVGYLKSLPKKDVELILQKHWIVKDVSFYCKRIYLPECMSCYNHHIGSHTIIDENPEKILNIKNYEHISEIPKYAEWAKDNILWLDELTKKTTSQKLKFI